MKKTPFILFMLVLTGCASNTTSTDSGSSSISATGTSGDSQKVSGIVQVNSYMYEVSAQKSTGAPTDMEDVRQQVYSEARAFCAKENVGVETVTIAWLYPDLGNPARAKLRFRCVGPIKQEPPQ